LDVFYVRKYSRNTSSHHVKTIKKVPVGQNVLHAFSLMLFRRFGDPYRRQEDLNCTQETVRSSIPMIGIKFI